MFKGDFYIVWQYIFKSTTGSLWKNKEKQQIAWLQFSRNNTYANK